MWRDLRFKLYRGTHTVLHSSVLVLYIVVNLTVTVVRAGLGSLRALGEGDRQGGLDSRIYAARDVG